MDQVFQFLGSLASIGGIPLAIYFFIKSKENKFAKVKSEIIRTLSYQIGENRELGTFEIDTVLRSKLRENSLKENSLSSESIVEDLATETISNPLIESDRKKEIIANLKQLYFKGEVYQVIDSLDKSSVLSIVEEQNTEKKQKAEEQIVNDVKKRIDELQITKEKIEKLSSVQKRVSNLSSMFAVVATIITVIASLLSTTVGEKISEYLKSINIDDNFSFVLAILAGILISLLASLISFVVKKFED